MMIAPERFDDLVTENVEPIVDDPFALAIVVPPLRSDSSVSPAFNVFGDISFPNELPKPVIHRTPEELGIPRVVPDIKPPSLPRNISPDPIRQDRTTFARAGAKKDKPRQSSLPAAPIVHHLQFKGLDVNASTVAEIVRAHSGVIRRAIAEASQPKLPRVEFAPLPERKHPMKVTEAQKQAIRDSCPSESCRIVGEKLGIHMSVVQYYRGLFAKQAKAAKPAKKAAAPKPDPEPATEPKALRSRGPSTIVTDKILDAWWRQLSYEKKTELFTGNYIIASPAATCSKTRSPR